MIRQQTALTLAAKFALSDTSRLHLFSLDGRIESAKHATKLIRECDYAQNALYNEFSAIDTARTNKEIDALVSYIQAHTPTA